MLVEHMAPCPLLFMAPPSPQAPPFRTPAVDQTGIEERVARIKARSIKKETKVEGLKLALSMIDLTTLEGADTPNKVRQLCYKAMHLHDQLPGLPTVAAICVYPTLVKVAKKALGNSGVMVAAVATERDCGEIILAVTPPEALDATASSGDIPTAMAVSFCMPPKRAQEDVSEPVRNTPSQPSRGEKKGKSQPVCVNARPSVELMPE